MSVLTTSERFEAEEKAWEVVKLINNFCKAKHQNREAFKNSPVEHLEIKATRIPSGISITLYGVKEQDIERIFNMFMSSKLNSMAYSVFKKSTQIG